MKANLFEYFKVFFKKSILLRLNEFQPVASRHTDYATSEHVNVAQ